ncbi:hypothetical protein [Microbacterium pumilum]|uniref:Multidrug transporter n=1 Tax=Microbacterium pumilum TaxID=344165 RepID=A0ABN2T3B6_9MICO
MSTEPKQPDDIIDANLAGGWDEVGDEETSERNADAAEPAVASSTDAQQLLTDAALQPDDPVSGEAARRGADPDMITDADRGEEP